jgi:hypothetical protein
MSRQKDRMEAPLQRHGATALPCSYAAHRLADVLLTPKRQSLKALNAAPPPGLVPASWIGGESGLAGPTPGTNWGHAMRLDADGGTGLTTH